MDDITRDLLAALKEARKIREYSSAKGEAIARMREPRATAESIIASRQQAKEMQEAIDKAVRMADAAIAKAKEVR